MKKLRILAVSLCMMLGLALTSCVGAAAMVDESGVSVDILVAEGVPYYDLNNVLLYYYWNGRYWYRYWYHDTWYYRPYVRPMPGYRRPDFTGPQSGDIWRHRPGPRHDVHRPDNHRPNTHRPNPPRQPDRMSPQPRQDRGVNRTPNVRPSGGMNRGGGAPSVSRGGGSRPSGGFGGPRSGGGHAGGRR